MLAKTILLAAMAALAAPVLAAPTLATPTLAAPIISASITPGHYLTLDHLVPLSRKDRSFILEELSLNLDGIPGSTMDKYVITKALDYKLGLLQESTVHPEEKKRIISMISEIFWILRPLPTDIMTILTQLQEILGTKSTL
ncbi:hypothetical protein P3342_000796 [Pyrenophora teres f. teres]|uniref:Uncharacterized protein n=1 Tax=Pyrenophora teres f. teres TaxID=97479 RepID=A0A6S6VGF9_9PLEO|nr:hypothetical protein HRS9139_04184 [Pyrenophora teres f. teres]KAE8862764.1 hypothetical protein PTNB29_05326 [Pyrenophora teres f. teres]KAK1918078.1 hypothetical protein P3342_000796 [Pyrenophora teres f. teres]CAE6998296.1 hypothetical protein PTTW11_00691 [Pyrenophora teres f. teres]